MLNEQLIDKLNSLELDNLDSAITYLFCLRYSLLTDNVIISDHDEFLLISKNLIGRNVIDYETVSTVYPETSDFIQDYQELFDKSNIGMPGKKGNAKSVSGKMARWRKDNPEFSEEDILKATSYYLSNTDKRYVRRADYFIFKRDTGRATEESSELSNWVGELDQNTTDSSDWSSQQI